MGADATLPPAPVPALQRNQGVSLTVRKPGMVLLIGQSRDFGRCRGKVAATGEPCKVALDKYVGEER